MEQEISEAINSLVKGENKSQYNIAMGFFQGYSSPPLASDPLGKRYANIKLHYKDSNGNDISLLNVPLLYPGSLLMPIDYKLTPGTDELIVLFSDRTLEQWKDESATTPQKLKNTVKDSLNHAFAIPVISHHNINEIVTLKLDLLNIIDRFMTVMIGDGATGPFDSAGSSSAGFVSTPGAVVEMGLIRTAIRAALN